MTKPKTAIAAKVMPTIWPVFRLPCACEAAEDTVGADPDVMIALDSPGRVMVEAVCGVEVDRLADNVSGEATVEEVDGAGTGVGARGIEGAPVAVAIMLSSMLVATGAPILGGRAEENAFEPGVSRDVAIGTTVIESCVGLIA
jgi:hypothetical protein